MDSPCLARSPKLLVAGVAVVVSEWLSLSGVHLKPDSVCSCMGGSCLFLFPTADSIKQSNRCVCVWESQSVRVCACLCECVCVFVCAECRITKQIHTHTHTHAHTHTQIVRGLSLLCPVIQVWLLFAYSVTTAPFK